MAKRAKKSRRAASDNEARLEELMRMPGLNLAKLYRGVVDESHKVPKDPASPAFPYTVELLDKCTARMLQAELRKRVPNPRVVMRVARAVQSAEHDRVQRYHTETVLGAAAFAVDGVNRMVELRQEMAAEKSGGRTIDTLSERSA